MRKFETSIVDVLNKECDGESVHFVGLGAHDFQISFGNVSRIQAMEEAVFSMCGREYSWTDSIAEIPFGLLIEQTPSHFELTNSLILRMCFKSGDFVEFHTVEGTYESVLVDLGMRDGAHNIEVF